jgi:gamma-glutamyl-gamma-aminobutyraldehyde dehydrogenase
MLDVTHDELLRRAKAFDPPVQHHIDGTDEPGGGRTFTVVSPRDGQPLAEVADAGESEVDHAVAAARRAFDSGPWLRLAPAERGRVLLRIAELLEEQREQLALTVSLEMGKPISDAHDIELRAAHRHVPLVRPARRQAGRRVPAHRPRRPRPRQP